MNGEIIQAQYERLDKLAAAFGKHSDSAAQMLSRVRQAMSSLQKGGWIGRGADAFFDEMDGTVLPAVQRLSDALDEARSTTLQISELIRQAEEEAAAPFGGRAAEGIGSVAEIAAGRGEVSLGAAAAVSAAAAPPRDVNSLFSDGYMDSMVGSSFRGEDSARLNRAMTALAGNPSGAELDRVLNEIAAIRGVPPEHFRAQYQRYLQLKDEAAAIARRKGLDPPEAVSGFFHGEFMGSTAQLRYGQVIGDAFGIDPVFGALLNPTGGMVGPGNFAFNPGDNDALGYHGIFHDAAGYLYNFHDLGPGYNYLGHEGHRDPGNPLVGQQSGVRYWNEKLHPGLVTDVAHGVGDFVIDSTENVIETVDTGIDRLRDFGDRAGDFMGEALEEAQHVFELVF